MRTGRPAAGGEFKEPGSALHVHFSSVTQIYISSKLDGMSTERYGSSCFVFKYFVNVKQQCEEEVGATNVNQGQHCLISSCILFQIKKHVFIEKNNRAPNL